MDASVEKLTSDLPDPESALRFLEDLERRDAGAFAKLKRRPGLMSDVAAIAAFSPLLATTLLQNPDYLWWLDRQRKVSAVATKEDLMESLARFASTHSSLEPQVIFARFRRRELLRIYLRDIRRLSSIAEITEEISNLADAILETALELAGRDLDNRYGIAQEADAKGRSKAARFCIVALGKLGSRELNYSSDIDLLFLYSSEGVTAGRQSEHASSTVVTNREYFTKLAQMIIKLVGGGEGGAYRVDLRLRPHGSLGALALSIADSVDYCVSQARAWEHQVLIRSRSAAGDARLFKRFFSAVEPLVFPAIDDSHKALENVRRSKERIDVERANRKGFDLKLSPGGIREIEFLAQALQIAHGGSDRWLRAPHTLISLSRLADRGHIGKDELQNLSKAYDFLRRTEHVLQMENGLQTHSVPNDLEKRSLLRRRMRFMGVEDFENALVETTGSVRQVFGRIFRSEKSPNHVLSAGNTIKDDEARVISQQTGGSFLARMLEAIRTSAGLSEQLAAMRKQWTAEIEEIRQRDRSNEITLEESKRLQAELAEASIEAALQVVGTNLRRNSRDIPWVPDTLSVLALGKLGGRSLDYGSDLDLVLIYDETTKPLGFTEPELYTRAVDLFVTALSSMTRNGSLYRVDLRLRPYGTKGLAATSGSAFLRYMRETAAIWEMLAFLKLRFVGGANAVGQRIEAETRRIIHERASALNPEKLAVETRRIRLALERQKGKNRRASDIDIKYGSGGILDVLFAVRYLQLRDYVPDDEIDRSTRAALIRLKSAGSLSPQISEQLREGYQFLTELDHQLRLVVGRDTRLPLGNRSALDTVAERMPVDGSQDLVEMLTFHRMAIRGAFDTILPPS